ncbi:SpoIIE family protein phosphatase [Streptomyces sp. NRRL S-87]|uniref:SpoIIE family protein phosphatase n=1 Tax=Streptomyces sp. NRRL S-87 TaxID=1463920 RepID=UPI0004C15A86|nr:SpoIIE family protein phosphatase [Streptomyces sp. NRRL S-87]
MDRLPTPPGEGPEEPDSSAEPAYTATASIDEQGIVTEWSEGARRLLGHESSDIVGRPAVHLLADAPGDPARLIPSGAELWRGTVALRHRDGHRLHRALIAHRWTSSGGTTKWFLVSAVPGRPRSAWEASLRDWAFAQSPCFLAVFDEDLRLVRANAAMERLLGLAEEEMRGLRLPEIAPDPVSDETERRMRLVLETGEPQYVAAFVRAAGAGDSPGNAWATELDPLRDPEARVRAVCLTAHDMNALQGARQRTLLPDEAAARIGTTLDSGRTAQELADAAVPRIADFAVVDLLEPAPRPDTASAGPAAGPVTVCRTAVRSAAGTGPRPRVGVGETTVYASPSPPTEALASGRGAVYATADPAVAQWLAQDPEAAWLGGNGTHSVLVVPLRAGGTALGVALLSRDEGREPFQPEDLWLAEELATRAAVGINKARRHTREHTSTMTLQRSLLPHKLPDHPALEIASRYLPAGTEAGVGGDWFDVIPLSGARVALVVGDVVGHGMRAAATMGRLRTAVRTLADVDLPPDELLTHLDDLVIHLSADEGEREAGGEAAGGIGTTCLYVVYDPVSRRCTLARAGHPPPAVVSPDGSVYLLDVPAGPPLGLGGLPFETVETELPEGSVLALYTDGLLQARDHDIDEALDSMFGALLRPASTLDTVCDRVLTALLTHRPDDDVALLVARTRALHADRVAVWDLESDPSVVSDARRNTTDQLEAWGLEEASFVTELLVSELVTNAIRYGQPPVQLRLIHQDTTLICEVSDSGSTAPRMRRARTFDEGGRGLLLVAQLAQRWGARPAPVGKTIWAEQSLTGVPELPIAAF